MLEGTSSFNQQGNVFGGNIDNIQQQMLENITSNIENHVSAKQLVIVQKAIVYELSKVEVVDPYKHYDESSVDNMEYVNIFIQGKRVEGLSERSLKYYKNVLTWFFDDVPTPLQSIDAKLIRIWLGEYQTERGCSSRTLDNMRRVLSTFFNYMHAEGYILKNPMLQIKRVKYDKLIKKPYSEEDITHMRGKILEHIYTTPKTQKANLLKWKGLLAIFDLLLSSGIRVGELVRLNKEDIHWDKQHFTVFGKGNKERHAYFDEKSRISLEDYLNTRRDNNESLFVESKAPYNRIYISGVERRISSLGEECNVKAYPHRFRRTFATRAVNRGMPLGQLQRLMGHAETSTTLIYVSLDNSSSEQTYKKYMR